MQLRTMAALAAVGLTVRALGRSRAERRRLHLTKAVTVHRTMDEVRRAWQDFASDDLAKVHFAPAPGERGTEIHVEHGRRQGFLVETELRRFKQLIETGAIVHSDASVHRGMHPAQPSHEIRLEAQR